MAAVQMERTFWEGLCSNYLETDSPCALACCNSLSCHNGILDIYSTGLYFFGHMYICVTKQVFTHTWWVIACPSISSNCMHTGCRQNRHRDPCIKTMGPRNTLNEFLLHTVSYNCTPRSVCVESLKKLLGGRGRRIKQYQRRAVWCWLAWKAITLIVCRMHSRLLQAKRLRGLLAELKITVLSPVLVWLDWWESLIPLGTCRN